jgi:DNA-binding XRE family transcriptional regulator
MVNVRKIISLRALHDMNQKDIAEKTGIKSYGRKEMGACKFTIEDALKIIQLYNLSLQDFNEIFLNNQLN